MTNNTSEAMGLTTPEQVERYAPEGDFSGALWMAEDPEGGYVRHSDYAALAAKLAEVEAERDAALGLQQTDDEQFRCAECNCSNGGDECTWFIPDRGGALEGEGENMTAIKPNLKRYRCVVEHEYSLWVLYSDVEDLFRIS